MTPEQDRAVLAWLARIPLLAGAQLAALLGTEDAAVHGVVRGLQARGLVDAVLMDGPALPEGLRLFLLTEAGMAALRGRPHAVQDGGANSLRLGPGAWLPAAWEELAARLTRVETAVAVAGFITMLVDDVRERDQTVAPPLVLEDAWSTPWVPRRASQPLIAPPGVEAAVRLRVGNRVACAYLVWDRAGAPPLHRRLRLADWYRVEGTDQAPWGARLPPILIVCPDTRCMAQWLALAEGSAQRRGRAPLPLALTTVAELRRRGPLAAGWWGPDGGRLLLLERLLWRPDTRTDQWLPLPSPLAGAGDADAHAVDRAGRPPARLNAWANEVLRRPVTFAGLPAHERWAALAVGLTATQHTLLSWVAHHPLLPRAHLAVYLELPERHIDRLMAALLRCGLVRVAGGITPGDRAGPRYLLTLQGAGYLAARDGVPVRRYLQDGVVAAAPDDLERDEERHGVAGAANPAADTEGGPGRDTAVPPPARVRLADLRRHPEHTAGVQHAALALAREAAGRRARGEDCRLLVWLSAPEAQEWFRHEGRIWHVWPDARFRLRLEGVDYDLLVEWDRGLVRRRDYARKLAAYAAYFADRPDAPDERVRLVVITTATAAARVQAELTIAARGAPRLLTASRLLPMAAVREGRIIPAVR